MVRGMLHALAGYNACGVISSSMCARGKKITLQVDGTDGKVHKDDLEVVKAGRRNKHSVQGCNAPSVRCRCPMLLPTSPFRSCFCEYPAAGSETFVVVS